MMKILIADDHPIFLSGLCSLFEDNKEMQIVGEAKDGREAVSQVKKLKPDIVVMDINMPVMNGIEATKEILSIAAGTKVIALSINSDKQFVKGMLDAGAVGYLLKDDAGGELISAIEKVNNGDMFLSSGVTRAALGKASHSEELTRMSVLQSKLQRPPITKEYVLRTKIIEELENNIVKPLSLISAGAGYGKSIAVSQWLEQTEFHYSWISLDEEHNDFRKFLYYLIESVEKVFPGLLENTWELVHASILPTDKELSNALINELCDIDQYFILVMDDYHIIKEKKIHNLLNEWLRFPPPSVHLCIITRRDPPLNIKSLGVSGRMTEIRMDDLSFNNEEITEFFEQVKHVKINDHSVKILQDKTEGWIIGLRLVSMVIKDPEEIDQTLQLVEGGVHSLADYLLTEVLSNQPARIQDQLLTISVLDRFCANLMQAIIEPKGENGSKEIGNELIKWLINSNLFIIPLDNDRKWFRHHHMFQDFLQKELRKRKDSQGIKEIHTKASLWFERNDFIEESIDHAMKAADTNRAVEIISKNWEVVSDSDNFLIVDKWLSYLPEQVIQSSINLLFARFYSVFKGHRLTQLPSVLGLILESNTPLNDAEKGYLAFINAMLNYYSAEGKKSIAEAEIALRLIPEKYTSFRGDARTYWFIAMLMIGKHDQALAEQKTNINKFLELEEPVQLGRTRTNIGYYALFNTDLPLLRSASEEMIKTPDLSNFMLGFYRHNLQYICWFSGDMEGVVRMSDGVVDIRYEFTSRLVIDCYVMKALALQELNKPDLATDTINDAIKFAEYTKDPANLIIALSGKARLQLNQGKIVLASDWLNKTELGEIAATMLWCIEVSEITKCRVLLARGEQKDLEEALELLIKYRKFSESIYFKIQTIDIMILQAQAYKKLGQDDKAYTTLKTAIELVAKGEWIRPFVEGQVEISELLRRLKEDGIHPDFIDMVFEAVETSKNAVVKASESNESNSRQKQKDNLNALTQRELEVLKCIAEGLRNQEIADKLCNSEGTIKKHISHMFQKMHVKNRLSLVSKAKEEGILE